MPSARGALVGTIITGLAIGAALQANISTILALYTGEDRNQQSIVTGDLHFATDGTQSPAITLNGTDIIQIDTSGNITLTGTLNSSGGLAPVTASLTSANLEGDGTASGWSVPNPYPEAILCDRVSIVVTTAPTTKTTVDIDRGTGTFLSGASSGKTLTDSYPFDAGVHTASGTRVSDSNGHGKAFQLDAAGGTNDYILFGLETGTGNQLDAVLNVSCQYID